MRLWTQHLKHVLVFTIYIYPQKLFRLLDVKVYSYTLNQLTCFTSWWLNQPLWKICSSTWIIFPQFSGWKFPKIFENCHYRKKMSPKTSSKWGHGAPQISRMIHGRPNVLSSAATNRGNMRHFWQQQKSRIENRVKKTHPGWWFQPNWKICSSIWIISPSRCEHKKYFKPPFSSSILSVVLWKNNLQWEFLASDSTPSTSPILPPWMVSNVAKPSQCHLDGRHVTVFVGEVYHEISFVDTKKRDLSTNIWHNGWLRTSKILC